jgi:hypothetical protein
MRNWPTERRGRARGDWEMERERARHGYGMYGPGEPEEEDRPYGYAERARSYGGGGYWGPDRWSRAGQWAAGEEPHRTWERQPDEEMPHWRGGYGPGRGAFGRGAWGQGGFGGGYGSEQDWTRGGPEAERGYGMYDRYGSFGGTEWRRAGRGSWGPYAGRGPRGYQRSDERIRDDVNDRLTDDPWIDAGDIDVQVQAGIVTLTGKVESRDDKRRAEDVAEVVSGVRDVSNQLRVERREGVLEKVGDAVTGSR